MAKGNIKRKVIAGGLTVCFLLGTLIVFGQSLQTITDKKDILIGEQIKLKVKASFKPELFRIGNWLIIPDSILHFEIVEKSKIDTVEFKDNSKIVEQTITLTSFDSGRWVFPRLGVNFDSLKDDTTLNVFTDSFYVNVSYSPADTTDQLRDIKPIIKVSVADYFWYYVLGGGILLLLAIFLLYGYFKKKKQLQTAMPVSGLSPFDEAMEELKKLSQFNLNEATEIKMFHIQLSDVFRNYLSRKQNSNLLSETTGDLLINLKSKNIQQEDISKLATALRCTDAVKFAKYLPSSSESDDCCNKVKETIVLNERQTKNNKQ